MRWVWALRACIAAVTTAAYPASATLYRSLTPDKAIEATAGDERDLFQLMGTSAFMGIASPADAEGWVTVNVVAQSAQPLTAIVYDLQLKEVARHSSTTGTIRVAANLGGFDSGYVRVVPTGGRFDSVPGTKFRRSASETFQNQNLLPAYRIAISRGRTDSNDAQSAALPPSAPLSAPATMSLFAGPDMSRGGQPPNAAIGPKALAVTSTSGPVDPKRWGMLAQMAGTTWSDSDSVYRIDWLEPNAAMLIKRTGLWGDEETLVTPAATGKGLLYRRNDPNKREEAEGQAPSSGNSFALKYDAIIRQICKLKKEQLLCDGTKLVGGKAVGFREQFGAITYAQAAVLIAAQPGVFPERPKGWFHPKLGLFADVASGRWELSHTKQQNRWTKTPGGLALEVGAGQATDGMTVHVASSVLGKRSMLFKESKADGKLYASVSAANHKYPEGRSNVQLVTRDNGRITYCYVSYEQTLCDDWSLSKDGFTLLVRGTGYAYALTQVARPSHLAGKFGLLGTLHEQSFQSPSGEIMSITVYAPAPGQPAAGASINYSRNGEVTASCGTNSTQGMDCMNYGRRNTTNFKAKLSAANDAEFTRDGTTYRLDGRGNLLASRPGQAPVLHRRITWADLRYMEQAKDDNDRIRYAYNDRQSRKESSDAFWRGIAQGIAEMPNTMRQHQAATSYLAPTNWSARIPAASSSQAGVAGYQSMGTISRVEAPQATLAERYRMEELERFKVHEQMYGSGRAGRGADPATPNQPYAKAYEQLARDRAESDAKRDAQRVESEAAAQLQAQTAAKAEATQQQDQQQAQAERQRQADVAEKAAANRSSTTAKGSSSNGGIIVRDTSADRGAWEKAEAERVRSNAANAAAAARRKAEELRRWEEDKKLGEEVNRVSEEMQRRAAQCKATGNCGSNKPAKAKSM